MKEMSYLDCASGQIESVLAKTSIFTGTEHPFPVLHIMSYLGGEIMGGPAPQRHTVIRCVGEKGEFGLAVPEVFGHKRMKVERKKSWAAVLGKSDIVYGYGMTNPITVVLDLEKIEMLSFSQVTG